MQNFVVVAVFKVKVTVRAFMIKIWLFLLYFLNCWFPGKQTWADNTSSYARVSCETKGLLHSGSRSQWRVKMECLSRWYHLNHLTFCFPTWYGDASLWVGVSYKKIDLLFSRSRSLQKLIRLKYDDFYCIFWTADPFATKLCLIVHYHKPERFIQIIFSKLSNIWFPTWY